MSVVNRTARGAQGLAACLSQIMNGSFRERVPGTTHAGPSRGQRTALAPNRDISCQLAIRF